MKMKTKNTREKKSHIPVYKEKKESKKVNKQ